MVMPQTGHRISPLSLSLSTPVFSMKEEAGVFFELTPSTRVSKCDEAVAKYLTSRVKHHSGGSQGLAASWEPLCGVGITDAIKQEQSQDAAHTTPLSQSPSGNRGAFILGLHEAKKRITSCLIRERQVTIRRGLRRTSVGHLS
ncbi:MAG: hypothetical protein A2X94_17155 [Bdellovibrionales bacterium GWB1_55_8]|nr:MAG: hypothetical protein A2X94_17155 [Bdellovibrionales bacterium GWB1_55_8]